MLLPFETVYALAGAALIGTAVTIVLFLVRVARWMRWIGPTLLAASAGLIGVLFWFGTQVVEVSNDGAGATIRKLVLVGSKTMTLGGKPVELSTQGRSETIIVNDSDRTLQLSTHSYASSPTELATETEPQEIAPHSVYLHGHEIDFFGPANAPPDHVESRASSETMYWLTW